MINTLAWLAGTKISAILLDLLVLYLSKIKQQWEGLDVQGSPDQKQKN